MDVAELRAFLRKYPNSMFRQDAENRIADYALWNDAIKINTKDSYLTYLEKSKSKSFEDEANARIVNFEATDEWKRCQESPSIAIVESFISKYGNSQYSKDAVYLLDVLKGEENYNRGNREQAYYFLDKANNIKPLSGNAAQYYQSLLEERKFKETIKSSDVTTVRNYLSRLSPSSPYYGETSNHLALLLGKKLDGFSTDYSMNEALSYASDHTTRLTVENYIQRAKQSRAVMERQRRAQARKRWWRENFKIGIDADIETNLDSKSGLDLFYSAGLVTRWGSYKHVFNMTFGVRYRWFRVKLDKDEIYEYDNKYEQYGGAVCIPLSLRFNIAKISARSKLFLGGGGEFGVSMIEASDAKGCFEKNFISVYPQIGITSPNFDISLYWKSYLNGPFVKDISEYLQEFKCKSMAGLQMSIYF